MKWMLVTVAALIACLLLAGGAIAQETNLDGVAFEQKPDALIDTAATFKDETGRSVKLADLLQDRPTVLMIGFYQCPMLCDPLLQNMATSLKRVPMTAGKEFNVITLSIDPAETPALSASKKAELFKAYGHPDSADGWHCLTGDKDNIDRLTASVGYRYATLPGQQFSHPAGLILLTPSGHVSRYLLGMTFQSWDLRMAILEAAQGKISGVTNAVLLRCYHYDPATGRYGFAIQSALRITGCLTATALFASIAYLSYRYRQKPEALI